MLSCEVCRRLTALDTALASPTSEAVARRVESTFCARIPESAAEAGCKRDGRDASVNSTLRDFEVNFPGIIYINFPTIIIAPAGYLEIGCSIIEFDPSLT